MPERSITLDRAREESNSFLADRLTAGPVANWPQTAVRRIQPSVIWLTGLSGAGKSTLAEGVYRHLLSAGAPVELLDGDALRAIAPVGLTRGERNAHVRRTAFMASRLEHHGVTVVCALMSPFLETRLDARRMCSRFIEVYVSTPLAECESRDPKGLYVAARRGEIADAVGIHIPYEPSPQPEVVLDTTNRTIDESVTWLLSEYARLDRYSASHTGNPIA